MSKDLEYINKKLDKVKSEILDNIDTIITKQKDLIINDSKMLDYLNETQLRVSSGSVEALLEIYILTKVTENIKLKV